ncbi:MAG: hypothetical protein ACREJU_07560, partial [Nitrospiraceae bacterium]
MIHIRHISLSSWFPSNDPIATSVAQLCILREDFLLELQGIAAAKIDKLDENTDAWRRIYFWRNTLRTLEEIKNALNRINSEQDYREALTHEPVQVQEAFRNLKKEINKTSDDFMRVLRNTIGAHLDEEAVQNALNEMNPGRRGLIEVGDTTGKIHYRFAGELIMSILLPAVPDEEQLQRIEGILGKTGKLIPAVSAVDNVINCYVRE